MTFEKSFFTDTIKSWGCGGQGGVWGVYLGPVPNMKKIVNKTIDTNLSGDFRKHTQTEEVDGNLKNPLQIKTRTT